QTIATLPTSPDVPFHSVIGYGHFSLFDGPGDGVVPYDSAEAAASVSRLEVRAFHTRVHRKLETVDEVDRILRQHLEESRIRFQTNAW
ncbi:MAG TPA: hypothetical protein VIY86_11775, partial [Pirellulaceae bacterium]